MATGAADQAARRLSAEDLPVTIRYNFKRELLPFLGKLHRNPFTPTSNGWAALVKRWSHSHVPFALSLYRILEIIVPNSQKARARADANFKKKELKAQEGAS